VSGEKRSVYINGKIMAALKDRDVENVSGFFNVSLDRYLFLLDALTPKHLSVGEYTEIFECMVDHIFGKASAKEETTLLPMLLRNKRVSVDVVKKVEQMTKVNRIALIDVIERSQKRLL